MSTPGERVGPGLNPSRADQHPVSVDVDDDALRDRVTRVLSDALGRAVAVTAFARSDSPFATLFPAEVLDVELDGSERLRLFLKHLGPEELEHPDKLGPAREIGVYEGLFQSRGLPVPRYFGSTESPHVGRFELFLEYVDDWNLKYQDLVHWYRAAHELGRVHAFFATGPESVLRSDLLQRLGAEYVWSWARRAAEEGARRTAELGRRLESLLTGYHVVARVVEDAQPTLVHNDLSPKNVLADRAADPARICLVDWECAGVGTGLFDLVNLSYGLEPDSRAEMRRSYLEGLQEGGGSVPSEAELSRLEFASEAHMALWRLAHCGGWGLPDSSVRDFCAEAESAVASLRRCAPEDEVGS